MDTFKALLMPAVFLVVLVMIIPIVFSAIPYILMAVGLLAIARLLVRVDRKSSGSDDSTPAK